ncbi:MAG: DUF4129 domain-containing protein [Candidatus Bipolaricaulia bacterium]
MIALRKRKLLILALTVVFVAVLLLLATSLSRLEFKPGKVYNLPPRGVTGVNPPPLPSNRWMDYLNMIFWAACGLLLIGALVAAIISKEYRRELLITALVALILFVGFYSFFHAHPQRRPFEPALSQPEAELPQQPTEATPKPVSPPHWSSFLLFLLIFGAAGALAWRFLPRFLRKEENPLEGLAGLAGEAAAELRGGAEVRDTVLHCYREMSELLSRRGHIPPDLRRVLTAREFEEQLRSVGVRDEHIARLSRLFEQVRYGGRESGPQEAAEAISCLEAIEQAYGREDGRGEA